MSHDAATPLQAKPKAVTAPVEILNEVFSQFTQPDMSATDRPFDLSRPDDMINRQTLCAAMLVCRRWSAPAKAALYQQVSPIPVNGRVAHDRYVKALMASQALTRPDITRSIKSLSLTCFHYADQLAGLVPLLHTPHKHFGSLTRLELSAAQIALLQPKGLSSVRFLRIKTLILGATPQGGWHKNSVLSPDLVTILQHFPRLRNLSLRSEVSLLSHDGYVLHNLPLTKTLRHLQIHTDTDYSHDLLQQLAHLPALKTLEVLNTRQWDYEVVDLSWADICVMPSVEKVEISTRVPCVTQNLASISNFSELRKLKLALAVYDGDSLVQDLSSFPESIEELSFSRLGTDVLMIVEAILHALPVWLPRLKSFGLGAGSLGLRREGRGALRMTLESLCAVRDELDLRGVGHDLACIAVLEERLIDA